MSTTEAPLPSKPWFESKTVWGGLVTLVAVILRQVGVELDGDTLQMIVDLLIQLGQLVGPLIVIWGRVRAKTTLALR